MTAAELVWRLEAAGLRLWVEGEQLRYRAPAGALTEELAELVAANRGDVIAHVRTAVRMVDGCLYRLPQYLASRLKFPGSSVNQAVRCERVGIGRLMFEGGLGLMARLV